MFSRIGIFFSLELYAIFLAYGQSLGGVMTDEAKYLLNIPYPHPPFMRWILSQFEFLSHQEIFARIVFATLLIQAVWIIWHMSKSITISFTWLASAAVIFQTGTIYMAPITALQGLVLMWLLLKNSNKELRIRNYELWVGLLWLISLFTAYQAALFLPIVIGIFWRRPIPLSHKITYIFGPVILLALYTLTNPLVIADLGTLRGIGSAHSFSDSFKNVFALWLIGGSAVGSIVSIFGMIRLRNIPITLSFFLFFIYVFFISSSYYAILFTPFIVIGVWSFFYNRYRLHKNFPILFIVLMTLASLFYIITAFPTPTPNIAQKVMSNMSTEVKGDYLLVFGPFGHQWQYESSIPVRRYKPKLLENARAVICLRECKEMNDREGWSQSLIDTVNIYTRAGN